jgi:hypothetical protein
MILRGFPHFTKYRFKTFLKTPFRFLGAIKAWHESSKLLRNGSVYLSETRLEEINLIVESELE